MKLSLNMIGIVTSQFSKMCSFYGDVLGMKRGEGMEHYQEFEGMGIRFALTESKIMEEFTQHKSFAEAKKGQSFELAFLVSSPVEVDSAYAEILEKGATGIRSPENMPWKQRTAFFADPDGNIHEIFAELEDSQSPIPNSQPR